VIKKPKSYLVETKTFKKACDLLMPWSNYVASCISVCQLLCNNYVHALCKKKHKIF